MPKYKNKSTNKYYDELEEKRLEELNDKEYQKNIKYESEDIDFDTMILDCFQDMKSYISNKIILFGDKLDTNHLCDFILNNM